MLQPQSKPPYNFAHDAHDEYVNTQLPRSMSDIIPIKQEDGANPDVDTSKEFLKLALHGSSIAKKRRACSPLPDFRPSQRARLAGPIISLKVGTNAPETVHIHAALLPHESKIFLETLSGDRNQSDWNELALPEEDAGTVRQWKDWLYMELVCVRTKSISYMTWVEHAAEWTSLVRLYVLGAKLEDHNCCNAVMEAMIDKIEERDPENKRWWPADYNVAIVYNGTQRGSPARDFLVEAYLRYPGDPDTLVLEDDELLHKAFLVDLTRALLKEREVDSPENHFSCQKERFFISARDEDQEMG